MTEQQRGFFQRWVSLLHEHAILHAKCGASHELHPDLHSVAWEIQAFAAGIDDLDIALAQRHEPTRCCDTSAQ